jgi:hypothetical protein
MAAMAGRWDQQLRRIRGRRHVGDRPVAGVGRQPLDRVADAGGSKGGADGGKHRGQLLDVVGPLGQLGGDHHLPEGGGRLGVVALQGPAVAAHEAAVGVGGVDGRRRVGGLIPTPGSDVGPWSLAAGSSGCGQLGHPLLVALLTGGGRAQPQRRHQQTGKRLFVADAEAGDGHMIGRAVAAKDAEGDVFVAAAFDLPRGADPGAVGIQQHRQQHPGLVGGVAVPVSPIRLEERLKIQLVDHVAHEPGQMVGRQPVAEIGWQQERLVAVAGTDKDRRR